MTNILLISEDFIKTNSEISDNVYGSYLLPAIRSAQDIHLQQIIGENLYNKILELVSAGTISTSAYTDYKTLLDEHIQPYLLEQVIADLIPIVSTKVANIGTVHSNDEHIVSLSEDEQNRLQKIHQDKADFYCRRMQMFLSKNFNNYSELKDCDILKIRACLDSAASTGLWLGGLRNRRIR